LLQDPERIVVAENIDLPEHLYGFTYGEVSRLQVSERTLQYYVELAAFEMTDLSDAKYAWDEQGILRRFFNDQLPQIVVPLGFFRECLIMVIYQTRWFLQIR
jgi:hypothetical protein